MGIQSQLITLGQTHRWKVFTASSSHTEKRRWKTPFHSVWQLGLFVQKLAFMAKKHGRRVLGWQASTRQEDGSWGSTDTRDHDEASIIEGNLSDLPCFFNHACAVALMVLLKASEASRRLFM